MLRFVSVGKDIYPDLPEYQQAFAFFDTTMDNFSRFGISQVWIRWSDFVHDYSEQYPNLIGIERYRTLAQGEIETPATLREAFAEARKNLLPVDAEKIKSFKKEYDLYREEGGKTVVIFDNGFYINSDQFFKDK